MSHSRNPAMSISSSSSSMVAVDASEINNSKFRSILTRMLKQFGLACMRKEDREDDSLEHNDVWLLSMPDFSSSGDLQSVHSSFRFSFCSQIEQESLDRCGSTATIFSTNLDLSEGFRRESKSRRMETVEWNISSCSRALMRFSYHEIAYATRNFSEARVLGRGALSCVYKGKLGILRTTVAIKRLDKEDQEAPKAFYRELLIVTSLQHLHVVPLLGFCIDPEEGFFLVYKFLSGGSLEQHLHDRTAKKKGWALSWSFRYKTAMGVAEAIDYLHNQAERCIVHRDIKPSNILLSSKKTPKLCDFGLATWVSSPSAHFLCKTVKGTFGYLAPEYFEHGKISDKTDVYAYGVVLLELLTGRKPIENDESERSLLQWAKPLLHRGAFKRLLDQKVIYNKKDMNRISRMVQASSACLDRDEDQRPEMSEVVRILRGECKYSPMMMVDCSELHIGNGMRSHLNHMSIA